MTMLILLVIAAVGFTGYAVYTQYQATDASQSVPKRVWASLVAAGAAVGGAVVTWFHSSGSPIN